LPVVDPKIIRIVIADDHPILRDGLRRLLEAQQDLQVVGEATNGQEAIQLVRACNPDILLLDLAMPLMRGIEALRILSQEQSQARVILLTAELHPLEAKQALRMGARGVVMKEAAPELLLRSIRCVHAGEYWLDTEMVRDWLLDSEASRGERSLTYREHELVREVEEGRSNREIAMRLKIREATVKRHLSTIYEKLGVTSRLELATFLAKLRSRT